MIMSPLCPALAAFVVSPPPAATTMRAAPVARARSPVAAVAEPPASPPPFRLSDSRVTSYGEENPTGIAALDIVSTVSKGAVNLETIDEAAQQKQVSKALGRMRSDMASLDIAASSRSQLTSIEISILTSTVVIAASSPFLLPLKLVEVIVPSMAALSAAIGLSAEYVGKTAVARGKETAAVTLQAASEAERLLSQAERAKAVVPLCVGISATSAAFALLAPELVTEIGSKLGLQIVTEIYLICPFIATLTAAVASLATTETFALSSAAAGLGSRRFASAGQISRSWLSATEQIARSSQRASRKWRAFSISVLFGPLLAALTPGVLSYKAIVVSAAAAAQVAYYLARAEYAIAFALDAVALKTRQAAVSDTYANQGARAGAILPFTSATASLCAATTVAVVELLPIIPSVLAQSLTMAAFPLFGSLVAAAASVSKARCEVDAEAATAAANELSRTDGSDQINPVESTLELVRLSVLPYLESTSIGKRLPKQLLRRG